MGDEEIEDGFDEDEIISESAEYSPKSEFSKAKIVYTAMEKCINARGKEMRAGYFNTKYPKDGEPIKVWVEDSRQIFVGCVTALKCLLTPETKLEDEFKKGMKKYIEEEDNLFKEYAYTGRIQERDNGRIVWKETKRKFIPEIDAIVIIPSIEIDKTASIIPGGWNIFTNAYWNELVKINDKIFSLMNELINKLNYFKMGIRF